VLTFLSPAPKHVLPRTGSNTAAAAGSSADIAMAEETSLSALMASSLSLALHSGADLAAAYLLVALFRRLPICSPDDSDRDSDSDNDNDNGNGNDNESQRRRRQSLFPALFCRSNVSSLLDPHAMQARRVPEKNYGMLLLRLVHKGMYHALRAVLDNETARREIALPAQAVQEHPQQEQFVAFFNMLFHEAAALGHTAICRLLLDHWVQCLRKLDVSTDPRAPNQTQADAPLPVLGVGLVIENPSQIPASTLCALLSLSHAHVHLMQFANTKECAAETAALQLERLMRVQERTQTVQGLGPAVGEGGSAAAAASGKIGAGNNAEEGESDLPGAGSAPVRVARPLLLRNASGRAVLIKGWTSRC